MNKLLAAAAATLALFALANPASAYGPGAVNGPSNTWKQIFAEMPVNQLVHTPPGTCRELMDSNCYELQFAPGAYAAVIESDMVGPMTVVKPTLRPVPTGNGVTYVPMPLLRDMYASEHGRVVRKSALFPDVASGMLTVMGKFAASVQSFNLYLYSGAVGDKIASPRGTRETSPSTHTLVMDCVSGKFHPHPDFMQRSGGFLNCTSRI